MKIQVGDLVKFKHDMFQEGGTIHLVTKVWSQHGADYMTKHYLHLHSEGELHYRANNFVVISKGKS